MATSPPRLTFDQIQNVWIQTGGSRALAPIMAQIALLESGGRPTAHNSTAATGDDSWGLWQINYFGDNRAPRTARYGPPESMTDPARNARAAVDLAQGGRGLSNWTTYPAARQSLLDRKLGGSGPFGYGGENLPGIKQGVKAGAATTDFVDTTASTIKDWAGFLAKLTDPAFLLRMAQIVAGGALAFAGIILLVRQVGLADPPAAAAVANVTRAVS